MCSAISCNRPLEQKQNYRNVAPSVQGGFFLRKNLLDLRGLTLYQFCFCCSVPSQKFIAEIERCLDGINR